MGQKCSRWSAVRKVLRGPGRRQSATELERDGRLDQQDHAGECDFGPV
jgi:hypothetical protein